MAQWIVKRGDLERTVADLATLRAHARSGRLRPDDLVRDSTTDVWRRVADLPELEGTHTSENSHDTSIPNVADARTLPRRATALFAAVAVLSGLAWWIWTRTPQYALRSVEDSLAAHDYQNFQKYVDVDGVTADLLTVMQMRESGAATVVVTMMSDRLHEMLKRTIVNTVESTEHRPPRLVSELLADTDGRPRIEYVRRAGKVAAVGLRFGDRPPSESVVYEIRMRDLGSHWQVAGLNAAQVVSAHRDYQDRLVKAALRRASTERLAAEAAGRRLRKHAVSTLKLTLQPSTTTGGGRIAGTLVLDVPAPIGGMTVQLTSVAPSWTKYIKMAPEVSIPAESTEVRFEISTAAVPDRISIPIVATSDDVARAAVLTLTPPFVISLEIVQFSRGARGVVTLSAPAPCCDFKIAIASSDAAAHVPSTVTVLEGTRSAEFPIGTDRVSHKTDAIITVVSDGVEQSATLHLQPPLAGGFHRR